MIPGGYRPHPPSTAFSVGTHRRQGTCPRTTDSSDDLGAALTRRYRHQAWAFDWTRGPILLRRRELIAMARPGDAVLEIGCGTGRLLPGLSRAVGPDGRVFGVECAAAMARRARRRTRSLDRVSILQGTYPTTRFEGASDLILLSYSLSMMPDPAAVLRAAAADLRPGGRIAILDFVGSRWRWMQRRITAAGVDLEAPRGDIAAQIFPIISRSARSAYGLWSYELLLGRG